MGTRPKRGGKKERATNKEKERRKGLQKKHKEGVLFLPGECLSCHARDTPKRPTATREERTSVATKT